MPRHTRQNRPEVRQPTECNPRTGEERPHTNALERPWATPPPLSLSKFHFIPTKSHSDSDSSIHHSLMPHCHFEQVFYIHDNLCIIKSDSNIKDLNQSKYINHITNEHLHEKHVTHFVLFFLLKISENCYICCI